MPGMPAQGVPSSDRSSVVVPFVVVVEALAEPDTDAFAAGVLASAETPASVVLAQAPSSSVADAITAKEAMRKLDFIVDSLQEPYDPDARAAGSREKKWPARVHAGRVHLGAQPWPPALAELLPLAAR